MAGWLPVAWTVLYVGLGLARGGTVTVRDGLILPGVRGLSSTRACRAAAGARGGGPRGHPERGLSDGGGDGKQHAEVTRVSDEGPRMYLVEGFASPEEIEHVKRSAEPFLTPSNPGTVTGTRYELPIDGDPVLEGIRKRMMDMFPEFEAAPQSTFRVRRYPPDGSYHPLHVDHFKSAEGTELVLTIMLYLSTPSEGGETYFPRGAGGKGLAFSPIAGNAAAWWSVYDSGKRAGERDDRTLHEGRPIKKGVKWNATYFVYAKRGAVVRGAEPATAVASPARWSLKNDAIAEDSGAHREPFVIGPLSSNAKMEK
uniref:Fe2OG dioxygenase domain-containing protein n=1 Tax=Lotharella oceanica TaxID=641309 RepID=A0A7S2TIR4_9EUKA|mmetsp:Transcript_16026/g.30422  ORF Transcript_16026/g.30422 Transcript_16026/m.30422 type:complete len:312 (+) Transcript_16026:5-940(+)